MRREGQYVSCSLLSPMGKGMFGMLHESICMIFLSGVYGIFCDFARVYMTFSLFHAYLNVDIC